MTKRRWIFSIAAALLLAGVALFSYQRGGDLNATRAAMLDLMPTDASSILFADVAEIRNSAFAVEFYNWAPQPQIDPEYVRFLRDTGFDYERDLDRVAMAVMKRGSDTTVFTIADGRFDRKKIEAYASHSGTLVNRRGRAIFSIPPSASARKMSLAFLRDNRIALTDEADLAALLSQRAKGEDARQWQKRFERLAGSPVFAVIRQDAAAGGTLASQAPGGLQSPQLAALLNQLLWITLAGKPEGDQLRVVVEGECGEDRTARQLADLLNGMLVLAQAGLNGPDNRRQLDPQARDAYIEILRGTDVSRIDRGETKAVRLIFNVTPKLLDAAKAVVPTPSVPSSSPANPTATPASTDRKSRAARAKSHK
jgi:hypothetical protein